MNEQTEKNKNTAVNQPDNKNKEAKKEETTKYELPAGNRFDAEIGIGKELLEYTAIAEWLNIRDDKNIKADMFHIAYLKKGCNPKKRPLTFVFNGGPGAASAYLHIGAMGPKTICLEKDGTLPPPPVIIEENQDTWLSFTDLVFIDPIGTGYSRVVYDGLSKEEEVKRQNEFFDIDKDLESLGEFMQRFLTDHKRWESPLFIAGESYGGFRTAKLAKILHQGFGLGINGSIIISPALEFAALRESDYDILNFIDTFPTMCASAAFHNKSKIFSNKDGIENIKAAAEKFLTEKLTPILILGPDHKNYNEIIKEMSDMIGMNLDLVANLNGRVTIAHFVRNLLKEKRLVCGLYDTTVTAVDPFPGRNNFEGPDPTLFPIERVFTSGINSLLSNDFNIKTNRLYKLLSFEVNRAWASEKQHILDTQVGSVDELRYGMSINPHMKVFICHGYYDLVTPFYSSERIVKQMQLTGEQKKNLFLKYFYGGHMFYSKPESKKQLKEEITNFVKSAVS